MVEKSEISTYNLTEEGFSYYNLFKDRFYSYFFDNDKITIRQRLDNDKITIRQRLDNDKITIRQRLDNDDHQKQHQLHITSWLKSNHLTDCERVVVEVLVEHFNRTGSPYFYITSPEDLYQHGVNFTPEVVASAIKKLREDGIVYLYKDKSMGSFKLGLKKQFIESMKVIGQ
ncbi:MAG: hypothetical protein QXS68_04085 [Candidatus Methanomethylicaceae archaeon]